MTGEDSAAVWIDFVPEAIHNPVAIKHLVSVLWPDIYVNYVYLFLHHNRFCIYILISSVQVLSF